METPPKYDELAKSADISLSYANEILSGKRQPSRALAIHIFRSTGWRHDLLGGLNDEALDLLESLEPWVPSRDRAA